jgi:ribosomal protein L12E/L44/L45/RPP1/RPP2
MRVNSALATPPGFMPRSNRSKDDREEKEEEEEEEEDDRARNREDDDDDDDDGVFVVNLGPRLKPRPTQQGKI